ncbi:MAG: N-acetyltransferase family protein [Bacteroidota bacterium]
MITFRLAEQKDVADIHAIYIPFVTDTHVSFEYEIPSQTEIGQRLQKTLQHYPWIVAQENGKVIGYAYAGSFRYRTAYSWSAESSIYLSPAAQGKGLGKSLYQRLLALLKLQGFQTVYAGISLPNPISQRFHDCMGFEHLQVFQRIGFKKGRWHDVDFWQIVLEQKDDNPRMPRGIGELSQAEIDSVLGGSFRY